MPTLLSLRPPTTYPARAYPDVHAVVDAVDRGDVPGALRAYQAIPLWSGRWLAAHTLGLRGGAVATLSDALPASPTDSALRTLLGGALVGMAWRVRSSLEPQHVSAEQFELFHQRLREADQVLGPVAAADPANVAAGTLRVTIARGLQMGLGEARSRYHAVARQDPHFLPAQRHLLRQLCPKWGGSTEEMYAFARERVAQAPPGSAVGALIVEAHVEHWTTIRSLGGWFGKPEIREEIDRAAQESVLHPEFQGGYDWVYAYNMFAFVYTRSRRYRAAAPMFKALGRYVEENLWSWAHDSPGTGFWLARTNTMVWG